MQVGDVVQWTSQAAGSAKTKKGAIVEVVAVGKRPDPRYGNGFGSSRDKVSYVVRVPSKSGRGKGQFYWPVATLLTPVND